MFHDQKQSGIDKQIFKSDQYSQQDKSFDRDLNEISQIEKFLQRNYRDVNNLQSYLINQLQTIENCKSRNKKVYKMIVNHIIPTFTNIKIQIANLKSAIPLIHNLTTTYIEAIYEKSAALLIQKQAQCSRYEIQIEDLKRQVQEFKEKQKQSKIYTPQKINQINNQICNQKQSYCKNTTQKFQLDYLKNQSQIFYNKSEKTSINYPKNITENQEISVFKDYFNEQTSKPREDKLNKYQQVYQNILKSKKVNITYKCEKSPIKGHQSRSTSKSPYHGKIHTTQKEDQVLQDRKLYIKQKIEKIKLKAECKQYQRNVACKQRFR